MSHTPGPWTVKDFNEDDLQRPTRFQGPCVVYADDDCLIHPVADCSCNHTCRDAEMAQANARLIAAAPEMLEALWIARDILASLPSTIYADMVDKDDMAAIETVIAKAEGK